MLVARDAARGVGCVEEEARERVGGAREEEDEERRALLERAAKLMVKAGYRAYAVRIKVAGKEKGYSLMESASAWTWSNVEICRRSERHFVLHETVIHPA